MQRGLFQLTLLFWVVLVIGGVSYFVPERGNSYQEVQTNVEGITLEKIAHTPRGETKGMFVRHEGSAIGLDWVSSFDETDFVYPLYYGSGIASADFDQDGFIDLVTADESRVLLYKNKEGERFSSEIITSLDFEKERISFVSPIDYNNDGWTDLYLANYGGSGYILENKDGQFDAERIQRVVPGGLTAYPASATFGDVNKDGLLDVFLGMHSYTMYERGADIGNRLFLQEKDGSLKELSISDEEYGHTLTALFSDVDQDGYLDLFTGNDYSAPDTLRLGSKGGLSSYREGAKRVPIMPFYEMSIDTADIDNDLDFDVLAIDMTMNPFDPYPRQVRPYCEGLSGQEATECQTLIDLNTQWFNRFDNCESVPDSKKEACFEEFSVEKNKIVCEGVIGRQVWSDTICEALTNEGADRFGGFHQEGEIPQAKMHNALLIQQDTGAFSEESEARGIEYSGWGWTGRFADYDNDTWQDVYVVNGVWKSEHLLSFGRENNLVFQNNEGDTFRERGADWGLGDYFSAMSYTVFDFDNDGDLDIAVEPVGRPLVLYENQISDTTSVTIDLVDMDGVREAIGARVIVQTDEGAFVREVKKGGGLRSFDAPRLHFGLGGKEQIVGVTVIWPDGKEQVVEQVLPVNTHYRITRVK